MFIRDTELLTLDDQVDTIDRLVRENDYHKFFLKNAELIHENNYVSEGRWREGDEVITSVTCLLYTSPSPRDRYISRMPSSA